MTMTLCRVAVLLSLLFAHVNANLQLDDEQSDVEDGGVEKRSQEYTSLGCWKDTINRAIPQLEGKCARLDGWWIQRANKMQKCVQCAKEMGIKIFSLQANGWCAGTTSDDDGYKKYGPANNCPSSGLGGGWANNVYRLGPPPLKPDLGKSDIYCDKRAHDCSNLNFVVASFGSATATCHFKKMEGGLGKKWEDSKDKERVYDAVLDGDTKAKCHAPSSDTNFASYKLVIKNEKGQEANFGQIFIYDSECVNCANGKCDLKASTCLIKNRCYKEGDSHPIDSCKLCRTEVSTTAFSYPDQPIPPKVAKVDCGPPARQDVNYGKNCPSNAASCINGNVGYRTLAEAWERCGKVPGCGFVMRYVNGYFYLRRLSDPYVAFGGIWGYTYKKCTQPTPPPPVTTTSCVNYGSCSYMPVDVALLFGIVGRQIGPFLDHKDEFFEKFLSNFKVSKSGIHFGLYTYGDNIHGNQNKQRVDFSITSTEALVLAVQKSLADPKKRRLYEPEGYATITKGVEKIKLDFLLGKTGRESQKIVVIMANSEDVDGIEKLKEATQYFKGTGVKVVGVDMGSGFPGLKEVASTGAYVDVNWAKDMKGAVKAVSQAICKAVDVHEYPPISKPVVVAEAHEGHTRFKCDYKPTITTSDTRYEVSWYRSEDDSLIKKGDLLHKEEDKLIFGNEIYCKVLSYFVFSPDTKSDLHSSDPFYMGIQLKTKPGEHKLTLTDSDPPTVIQVESTVPIICSAEKQCPIEVAIVQPDSKLLLSKCQVKFPCNHRAGSNDHVTAVVKRDVINTGSSDIEVAFEFIHEGCSPEWKNYGESMVKSEDEPLSLELSDELTSNDLKDEPKFDQLNEGLLAAMVEDEIDEQMRSDEMNSDEVVIDESLPDESVLQESDDELNEEKQKEDDLEYEDEFMEEDDTIEGESEDISKRQRRRRRGRPGGSTTVTVITRPGAESSAQGDPHFVSYDGLRINLYIAGDFIYAMNPKRDFMVQARVKGIVNCAVAAKEGRDVVIIDACNGSPKVQFASKALPNPNTIASKIGNLYQIRFPSGAVIKFLHHGWYNDINIFPVPGDFGNLVGIQGSWDGNKDNDNLLRDGKNSGSFGNVNSALANSWRPKAGENLFTYDGGELKCDLPKESKRKWCTCGEDNDGNAKSTCDVMSFFLDPPYAKQLGQVFESEAVKECEKQMKENSKIADDRTDKDREAVVPKDRENINEKWPTPTGKTEAQATKVCEDTIKNSPLGKECARILGDKFDFKNFITSCVEDIRIMDDTRYAQGYHSNMAQQCKDDISKMTEDTKEEPKQGFCPNDCSGHGTCTKSKCTCDSGYIGEDCSRKADEKIEILKYANNPCDVRKGRCWRVEIHGKGLYAEDEGVMKGNYEMKKVVLDKSFDASKEIITAGDAPVDVRNKELAYYGLRYEHTAAENHLSGQGAVMYTFKLHKEGKEVEHNLNDEFIVYDGKCVECNLETRECDLKMDTCLVDGKCYTKDDGDKCKKVKPKDKGLAFCRRYKVYCKQIAKGGAHQAYMKNNCADSCKKLLGEQATDKGMAFCKPYKRFCTQISNGGAHAAYMKKNCAQSCKKLMNEQPSDKGLAFCRPYKSFCKHIADGGPHSAYMKKNCAESCKKLMVKPRCVDRIKTCKRFRKFCKDIKSNGTHKKYMLHNCCAYCNRAIQ